jgi:hypothetical protein
MNVNYHKKLKDEFDKFDRHMRETEMIENMSYLTVPGMNTF